MDQQLYERGKKWQKVGIVGMAISALAAVAFAFVYHHGTVMVEQSMDHGAAIDSVKVGEQHGSLLSPSGDHIRFAANDVNPLSYHEVFTAARAEALHESGLAWVTQRNAKGEVVWEGLGHNALTYWGQIRLLSHTFSAVTAPAAGAWYIALLTATPANPGVAWGSVTELTSSGYARVNVTAWTCTTSTSSNNSCATGSRSWTNSSGSAWTGVTAMAIVDAASGAPTTYGYISYIALSTTRTLQNGDSLTINPYTLTLQ